jgi:hypothetical protein
VALIHHWTFPLWRRQYVTTTNYLNNYFIGIVNGLEDSTLLGHGRLRVPPPILAERLDEYVWRPTRRMGCIMGVVVPKPWGWNKKWWGAREVTGEDARWKTVSGGGRKWNVIGTQGWSGSERDTWRVVSGWWDGARDHLDHKRGGGQASEDEEGKKEASLIAWPGGEQMARGRMTQKATRQERGPHWLHAERQKMFGLPVRHWSRRYNRSCWRGAPLILDPPPA